MISINTSVWPLTHATRPRNMKSPQGSQVQSPHRMCSTTQTINRFQDLHTKHPIFNICEFNNRALADALDSIAGNIASQLTIGLYDSSDTDYLSLISHLPAFLEEMKAISQDFRDTLKQKCFKANVNLDTILSQEQ